VTPNNAQFAAAHALLLLCAAILFPALCAAIVLGLVHLAVRHADRLWAWIDLLVPGHLIRPRTYLLVHLALGCVMVAAVTGFVFIAEDVFGRRQLAAFDLAFAEALQEEVRPRWRAFFWGFTWLGSFVPLAILTAAAIWRLLSRGRTLLAIMWAISQGGAIVISQTLKAIFARSRPDGADPLLFGNSLSFPSGHAVGAIVFCGVGAYILMRTIRSWRARVLLVTGAFAWALPMGFSRLYLGVHYFSDVVAGFLIGAAWVAVCISGMEVALTRETGALRFQDARNER
jgi:undecaprenyl-diphosphatase